MSDYYPIVLSGTEGNYVLAELQDGNLLIPSGTILNGAFFPELETSSINFVDKTRAYVEDEGEFTLSGSNATDFNFKVRNVSGNLGGIDFTPYYCLITSEGDHIRLLNDVLLQSTISVASSGSTGGDFVVGGDLYVSGNTYGVSGGSGIGDPTFLDSDFEILNSTDITKSFVVSAGAISTGTTRTFTMADQDVDLQDILDHVDNSGIHFEPSSEFTGSSFPGSPYQGQQFYRTDLEDTFWYDSTRSKWLGSPTKHVMGYNANLANSNYIKHAGNSTGSASTGENVPYNSTITAISYVQVGTSTGDFDIYINGVDTGIGITHTAANGQDITLNYDISAGDVVTVYNSGTNSPAPIVTLVVKRRAS